MKIAVTGANSSVGLNLLAQLTQLADIQVIAAVRSEKALRSIPAAPQIEARIISYADDAQLAESLRGADCVVHLAGILIEDRHTNYSSANVDATAAVVAAAQAIEARHFIFTSVVGADAQSANAYFRSKGQAEAIVRNSGIAASIIRTPLLLGKDTTGGQAIVSAASRAKPRILGGGNYTLQPLDVDDLSKAILHCCSNPTAGVDLHELAGPEALSYRELITRTASLMGRTVTPASLPLWLAKLGAFISSRLRGGGITPTVIDVITTDELITLNADIALGISLTPLHNTLRKLSDTGRAHD
jgi:uncharacterized protein YbjT (DUF2867 family)